jgi:hypothetical protein
MFWRAFRKPLAFAVDAVYGNSIDLGLEVITKKGLGGKAWLLMLVNVLLPAFIPECYAAAVLLSSAETLAPIHAAASAAQAASCITGKPQVMRFEMGNWFYEHGVGIVYITRPSRLRTRIGGQDAR